MKVLKIVCLSYWGSIWFSSELCLIYDKKKQADYHHFYCLVGETELYPFWKSLLFNLFVVHVNHNVKFTDLSVIISFTNVTINTSLSFTKSAIETNIQIQRLFHFLDTILEYYSTKLKYSRKSQNRILKNVFKQKINALNLLSISLKSTSRNFLYESSFWDIL